MARNQKECREEAQKIVEVLKGATERIGSLLDDEQFLLDSSPENMQEYKDTTFYGPMMEYIEKAHKNVTEAIGELEKMDELYINNAY